jgi:hypothetical protein
MRRAVDVIKQITPYDSTTTRFPLGVMGAYQDERNPS